MSTNLPSFRVSFESQLAALPPEHQAAMRTVFNSLTDIYQAIPVLKTQIDANKTSVAAVTDTVNNNISTETIVQQVAPNTGFVNDQTGTLTYATAQSDYGKLVVLSDASAIAVTLSAAPTITLPFWFRIANYGAGTATLTPASGLIYSFAAPSGASSYSLASGSAIQVNYDGTNFWTS